MNITFNQVTDLDKNLDVLADVKADCLYRQSCGYCPPGRCRNCKKYQQFNACYSQLAVCDKLKVDTAASWQAGMMNYYHYKHKQAIFMRICSVAFIVGLVIFIAAISCAAIWAEPAADNFMWEYHNDKCIVDTLKRTHSQVKDLNSDGKVNCIDYTLTFKHEWDKVYSPENCEIVRNYNKETGWHHLFVRARNHRMGDWLYVEPQAGATDYIIYEYWPDDYVCWYNIFGESPDKYLKEEYN